jgi:hypothetical protein
LTLVLAAALAGWAGLAAGAALAGLPWLAVRAAGAFADWDVEPLADALLAEVAGFAAGLALPG